MQKDEVYIVLPERMAGCDGLHGIVDHAKVHNFGPEPFKFRGNLAVIAFQALAKSVELFPIRIEPNTEQANPMPLIRCHARAFYLHSQHLIPRIALLKRPEVTDLLYKMIGAYAMQRSSSTEFRYFPVSSRDRKWGLFVHTIGVSHIAPNAPYPPAHHPSAYQLDWEHGRVLREFQVVYISQGGGLLETRESEWRVRAGEAIMLHPGVWHRYRPDPQSGWQEHWVGFSGPIMQHLAKQRFFAVTTPRFRVRDERPLAAAFHALQQTAGSNLPALQQVLAGHTMTILGLLVSSMRPENKRNNDEARIMESAVAALSDLKADELDLQELAASLNVSYSWFRRTFKERIGLSPHQFRLHLKLTTARDLLQSTSLSVKEVCVRTGFHSEQYFCRLFKKQVGNTPGTFRSLRVAPVYKA